MKPAFLKRLAELVDLKAIAKSGIKVVYDPFWGAGRGYISDLLREAGVQVETVHDYRDVLFGGHAPEPSDELLGDAKAKMREMGADLVMATDGDADRFGIVDRDGTFIQPNYIIALLFDYLVETRGWRNGVAKSVATTNLVNALAEYHKVPLYETPVGFKYIGELINEDKIAIGGEESAGLTIRGHVPEKDGVLAGLLVAEMVATRGKSLGVQLKELFAKVGSFYPVRENFRLTPEAKAAFTEKLKADPTELGGRKVVQGGADRRAEADSGGRFLGLLPALRNRAGGAGLHGSAQRAGHGSAEARRRRSLCSSKSGIEVADGGRERCKPGSHAVGRSSRTRRRRVRDFARRAWRPAGTVVAVALALLARVARDQRQERAFSVAAEARRGPAVAAKRSTTCSRRMRACANASSGSSPTRMPSSTRRGRSCTTPSPAR